MSARWWLNRPFSRTSQPHAATSTRRTRHTRPLTVESLDDRIVPAFLSIPQDLVGSPSGTLSVPVNITVDDASPVLVLAADYAISYDPAVLSANKITLGDATSAADGFAVNNSVINNTLGVVTITTGATLEKSLASGFQGTMIFIEFTVNAGATAGSTTPVNLLSKFTPAVGFPTFTNVANFSAELTLNPAPTNADTDGTDGKVTIYTPPVTTDDAVLLQQDSKNNVISVLGNDTGLGLSVTKITQGSLGGVVTISNGGKDVTYTPVAGTAGTETFTYTISDVQSAESTATVTVTLNRPPIANNDSKTIQIGTTSTTISVLGNDTFAPDTGETLTVTAVTQGTNGAVAITNSGKDLKYTPTVGFGGSDTFTYTVSDGKGGTDTATVTVKVNRPPTATDDSADVQKNSKSNSIAVLANDSFAPDTGETLTITGTTNGANGTVTITDAGTKVAYTPNANFQGQDTFTYTISDGAGGTATGKVTINVLNNAPTATDDDLLIQQDSGANTINVLLNDSIAPDTGETLTVTAITQGTSGTVAITNGGKDVSYTPNKGFSGTDKFTYTIDDGNGGTDTATVNITVNAPPSGVFDGETAKKNSKDNVYDVLSNDSFAPDTGETLSISQVGLANNGIVTIVDNNTKLSYTPNANFQGLDSFVYVVSDGRGGEAVVTVNVTVQNNDPTATDDSKLVQQDSGANTIDVLANDNTDPDTGETLTVTAVTQGTSGAVVITNGGKDVSYAPNKGFAGKDSFTYTIDDGNGGTATATVNVSVNAPPLANPDSKIVQRNSGANTVNVLANDSIGGDIGETFTIVSITQGKSGAVVITNGGKDVSYAPNKDFSGDDTFTYTIQDSNGGKATATVSVAVNAPPTAKNDTVTDAQRNGGAVTINVLGNDSFAPDTGETLTIVSTTQGASGVVTITNGGKDVSFAPNKDFAGFDVFDYTISDGRGGTSTATVSVRVNAPPTAVADKATVQQNALATAITVLANDTFTPDTGETLTIASATQGTKGGSVVITGGGSGLTYRPLPGFGGTDSFTYTIDDGFGGKSTATVTMTVNRVPTAVNDVALVQQNSKDNAIAVLANDTDPDGQTLAVLSVTSGSNGATVTILDGGKSVAYRPAAGFFGTDTFTYTATDNNGGSATASVTVTVNALPTAKNDTGTIQANSDPFTIDVLANDSFAPDTGETLTVTAITQGTKGGSVEIVNGGKQVTYRPATGFGGTDTFTYTISDGRGGTATAAVTVGVNRPPVAVNDKATTLQNEAIIIPVLANDSDPDGDTFTISTATAAQHGTLEVSGGSIKYVPITDFVGSDKFTYTINDGRGGIASGTVSVTINSPESPSNPSLVGEEFTVVGPDQGAAPVVRVYGPSGQEIGTVEVFESSFTGGVRTATGDFNGDGQPDIVAGTGPGRFTEVRILDAKTGAEIFNVKPFEESFTGGVYVAVGDVNGDGIADLAITPDEGGGPRVRIFDGKTLTLTADFFGIDDPNFRGGARAAFGDVNGDGVADLVVSAGFLGGPRVSVYDGTTINSSAPQRLIQDFFAFEETLRNGVFVAVGDVNGDGFADLVLGGGPGGGPRVRIADAKILMAAGAFGSLDDIPNATFVNFFAGNEDNRGGIRVSVKNLDSDNFADLVTGAGTDAGDQVVGFLAKDLLLGVTTNKFDLDTFGTFTGGVFVG